MIYLLYPLMAVLLTWSINFSITAHYQQEDKDMWIQHLIAAVMLVGVMVCLYLLIHRGG